MKGDRIRLGLGTAIWMLFVISITVAGCSPSSESDLDACLSENSGYADQAMEIDDSWSRAMNTVADSTDSVPSFAGAINGLMTLKKTAQGITSPACVGNDHESYVEGMSSIIVMYQEVMNAPDANPDPATLSSAKDNMTSLQQRFGGG